MITSKRTSALAIALALGLGACSSASQLLEGVTGEKDTKLPGQRENILTTTQTPTPSAEGASEPVVVPAAVDNSSWLQPGGSASNAPGNLAAGASLARAWSVSAGEGSSSDGRLVASPIVVGGTVYVLDAATRVNAITSGGSRAWSVSLVPEKADPDGIIGGGLASDGSRIYATTGFGEAVALDARTGTIAWRKKINVSLRAAPTVTDDVMYFTGVGNEVIALRTSDGSEVWRTEGTGQRVSIIGSTSPAVAKDVIVIPTTTGDVMAYNTRDGFPAWADSLASSDPVTAAANIGAVGGRPVIDGNQVFAISNAGKLAAISLANGERQWAEEMSGTQTPWVAGDYVFVITNNKVMTAVSRRNGAVKWTQTLPGKSWAGPVLAGGRLLAVSADGKLASLSPQTGQVLATSEQGGAYYIAPVVAGGMVYILDDDGKLSALR
ncbi:MAG: PQQ-binding-like beta-propeller repeat protein [Hyphomicrobiales bacterium]